MTSHSRAFQPFRALGLVSNHVPFSLQTLGGGEQFVTTCIGRSFHVYNCDKLRLVMASDQVTIPLENDIRLRDREFKMMKKQLQEDNDEENDDDNDEEDEDEDEEDENTPIRKRIIKDIQDKFASLQIKCMASHRSSTITTVGSEIIIWQRGKIQQRFSPGSIHPVFVTNNNSAVLNEIHSLLLIGDIGITCCDANALRAWSVTSGEIFSEIDLPTTSFTVSAIVHPSTYLNKILLGSRQGPLQLWNIKTQSLIYEFKGWNSPVTYLAQSPAVDVVAVGLENGSIYLLNLKQNIVVMKFSQEGPVTSITFRTDNVPTMATCGTDGNIALWNLEHRRLSGMVKEAHDGTIASLEFLPSQPILLSASADNSVKMWIFDQTDGSSRLLRSREGHIAPPSRIRFYGSAGSSSGGHDILSAGQDKTFRVFSTIADAQSKELSQGHLKKKSTKLNLSLDQLRFSPIIDFAAEDTRERDWDNIVTCHLDESCARSWRFESKAIGKHEMKASATGAKVTSVTLSSCGNFVLAGLSSGIVDVFNIQSGLYRGSFGLKGVGHDGAVTGVVIDAINDTVVSCGLDGFVKYWNFRTKALLHQEDVKVPMTQLVAHRESGMVAAVCDDFSIRIFDIDTKRLVRIFSGHGSRITDMTFSPDGRWLVSSCMDTAIRVWDLPTACLVDIFQCESAATSVSFSPNGEYLASSHVDSVGIFLWANRTLFSTVSLKSIPIDTQPASLRLPSSGDDNSDDKNDDVDIYLSASDDAFVSKDQLSSELVTLSSLPKSRWFNLTNLETIKQRNKPKEAPKTNEAAPFFLPTVVGGGIHFDVTSGEDANNAASNKNNKNKFVNFGSMESLSPFVRLLLASKETEDFMPAFNLLIELPPAAIDIEIRSLHNGKDGIILGLSNIPGDATLLVLFLKMIIQVCDSKRNFDVIQSYLNVFLKIHGEALSTDPEAQLVLLKVKSTINTTWTTLQDKFQHSLCLIQFMKNTAL